MLLSTKESSIFIPLYSCLISFATDRLGGVAGINNVEDFLYASNEARAEARDELLSNVNLIDEFVEVNPYQFPEKELSNLLKFEKFVSGEFFIERELKKYTIFLSDDDPSKAYGVLGLTDEIVDMIPYPPPVLVSAVLLPWKGQIICDGLISTYNVVLGRGIIKNLKESYRQAKARGIITSLDSD